MLFRSIYDEDEASRIVDVQPAQQIQRPQVDVTPAPSGRPSRLHAIIQSTGVTDEAQPSGLVPDADGVLVEAAE